MGRWSRILAEQLIAAYSRPRAPIRMEYADFRDYWVPIANAQGPVGDYVERLSSDRLETLAAAVRRAYLAGQPDGRRSMAATAWAARGVVP